MTTRQQMTVRQFARAGFEITGVALCDAVEAMAAVEMAKRGWKFAGYDENGDEVFQKPKEDEESGG